MLNIKDRRHYKMLNKIYIKFSHLLALFYVNMFFLKASQKV